jgi:hypothetical protein
MKNLERTLLNRERVSAMVRELAFYLPYSREWVVCDYPKGIELYNAKRYVSIYVYPTKVSVVRHWDTTRFTIRTPMSQKMHEDAWFNGMFRVVHKTENLLGYRKRR